MNTNLHNELENLVAADLDAGLVFSGTPTGNTVKGFAQPCSYSPAIDPDYIFHTLALTIRFQPLSQQGIQSITYALDRALGFRATRSSRALLHELAQRYFPVDASK